MAGRVAIPTLPVETRTGETRLPGSVKLSPMITPRYSPREMSPRGARGGVFGSAGLVLDARRTSSAGNLRAQLYASAPLNQGAGIPFGSAPLSSRARSPGAASASNLYGSTPLSYPGGGYSSAASLREFGPPDNVRRSRWADVTPTPGFDSMNTPRSPGFSLSSQAKPSVLYDPTPTPMDVPYGAPAANMGFALPPSEVQQAAFASAQGNVAQNIRQMSAVLPVASTAGSFVMPGSLTVRQQSVPANIGFGVPMQNSTSGSFVTSGMQTNQLPVPSPQIGGIITPGGLTTPGSLTTSASFAGQTIQSGQVSQNNGNQQISFISLPNGANLDANGIMQTIAAQMPSINASLNGATNQASQPQIIVVAMPGPSTMTAANQQVPSVREENDDDLLEDQPAMAVLDDETMAAAGRQVLAEAFHANTLDVGFVAPSSSLPNPGSALHGTGRCQPCTWFHNKEKGCTSGAECSYCHLCPKGEKKKRTKAKVAAMRMGALEPSEQSGAPPQIRLTQLLG